MNTILGGGKIIYSKPADQKNNKCYTENPQGNPDFFRLECPEMHIYQITQPCEESPGFFWIPRPVMSPGLFGPESPEKQTKRKKRKSDIYKVVSKP